MKRNHPLTFISTLYKNNDAILNIENKPSDHIKTQKALGQGMFVIVQIVEWLLLIHNEMRCRYRRRNFGE